MNTNPTSTTYSLTAGQMITRALRILGVLPSTGVPTADQMAQGIIALNLLLKGMQQDGANLERLEEITIPVAQYQGGFGNPVTVNPLIIELIEARWSANVPVVANTVVANTVAETVIFDQFLGKEVSYSVEGDVGTFQTTTAHAVDNLGYPLTYHFPGDQAVSSFVIDPVTAVITGTIPDPSSNPTLTAIITAVSNTGCSNTAVFTITPDTQSVATGWFFGVFTGAGTGVQPPTSSTPQTQSTTTYLLAGLSPSDINATTSGIPSYPFRAYVAKNNQEPFCYFDCNGTTTPAVIGTTTQDIQFNEGDFITVTTTPDYAAEVNGWVTSSTTSTIVTGSTPPDASVGGYVCVNLTVNVKTHLVATGAGTEITNTPVTIVPESGPYPGTGSDTNMSASTVTLDGAGANGNWYTTGGSATVSTANSTVALLFLGFEGGNTNNTMSSVVSSDGTVFDKIAEHVTQNTTMSVYAATLTAQMTNATLTWTPANSIDDGTYCFIGLSGATSIDPSSLLPTFVDSSSSSLNLNYSTSNADDLLIFFATSNYLGALGAIPTNYTQLCGITNSGGQLWSQLQVATQGVGTIQSNVTDVASFNTTQDCIAGIIAVKGS